MYKCPRCRQALRRDEGLRHYQFLDGGFNACERCIAAAEHRPPAQPPVYPVGERVPIAPGTFDCNMMICCICRHALFWVDKPTHIRVQPEDLAGTRFADIEPGGYGSCRDCIKLFAPSIRARLIREGKMREDQGVETMSW